MSLMLFPNALFKEKNKMNDKELEDHFERMKIAQEERKIAISEEVSQLTDEQLLNLILTINEFPTNDQEKMLKSVVECELEKRALSNK